MAFTLTAVTLFLGGGIVLLASLTVWRYSRLWRAMSPHPRALLPLHVWLIASSYLLLVVLMLAGGVSGATNLGDWRAAIRIPALTFGLVAMFVLFNFQRKTYRMPSIDKHGSTRYNKSSSSTDREDLP